MNNSINLNTQKKNNNNNIILSEGAINFLDNQILKDGDTKIIENEFIFQIIQAVKKDPDWYYCSLMDQNSKYGGFCINYESQYGEPKIGDIIQTKKIAILKLKNRETNVYLCKKVKKLKESKEFVIEPKNVFTILKKRLPQKKEYINNNNYINNAKHDKNNSINNAMKSSSQNLDLNKNFLKKYTLLSNFNNFTNNPIFLLKCRFKSPVKIYPNNNNNLDFKVQNYIFYDINGEEVQAVSFRECVDVFDNIIKVDSTYEISKVKKTLNKNEFRLTKFDFQLNFEKFTKVEEIDGGNLFKNTKIKDVFTPISNLTIDKVNKSIHCIIGIILEDKGIIEKKKENGDITRLRKIIIGDNTLHKINIKLWEEKLYPEKKYSKGDIIYIYNFKFKKYYNIYDLNSISLSEIQSCNNEKIIKELRQFYNKHQNMYQYKDMNFVNLNAQNNIEEKFIISFKEECISQYDEIDNEQLVRINGTAVNFTHDENNLYEGCIFCNKKSMNSTIVQIHKKN